MNFNFKVSPQTINRLISEYRLEQGMEREERTRDRAMFNDTKEVAPPRPAHSMPAFSFPASMVLPMSSQEPPAAAGAQAAAASGSRELSLGGPTGENAALQWSNPSPVYKDGEYVTDGMVWMGLQPATEQDKQAWADYVNDVSPAGGNLGVDDFKWDERSLVGRLDSQWSSLHNEHTGSSGPGGVGSFTYEYQHMPEGVQFTTRDSWVHDHPNPGDMSKVPAGTPFHYRDMGDNYRDLYYGPEPGSAAAAFAEQGVTFSRDDSASLFRMMDAEGTAIPYDRNPSS